MSFFPDIYMISLNFWSLHTQTVLEFKKKYKFGIHSDDDVNSQIELKTHGTALLSFLFCDSKYYHHV